MARSNKRLLRALGELHRPLQPAGQRGARQVGAADVGRAEAGAAMEQPGLGVQAGAPAIQRHAHLAARQARQFVQRARLGGTGVGGGEDAQPGAHRVRRPLHHPAVICCSTSCSLRTPDTVMKLTRMSTWSPPPARLRISCSSEGEPLPAVNSQGAATPSRAWRFQARR
jgi:hypothetical protein